MLQKILRNPLDSARAVIGGSEKVTEKWKKVQNQKIPALSPVNSWFKEVRGGAGGRASTWCLPVADWRHEALLMAGVGIQGVPI